MGWRGCQPLQEAKQAQNRGSLVHCVPKYWHTVSISHYFIFFLSGQSKLTAPGAQHKNTPEGVACSTRAEEPGSTSMGNGREKSSQGVLSKQGLKQAGLG